jgi:phenylpropionate dioxygenase-like ring-hydroxylating dioxygenase large terminal subunit
MMRYIDKILYVILLANTFPSYSQGFVYSIVKPFNEWHCIDFVKNIDKSKPHAYNVGDLPLVSWFDKSGDTFSTVNICSHMGSKLDHGTVKDGCLVCPYHGLQHDNTKAFGETMIFQDKLWWSYEPKNKRPPAVPFYNNKNFETAEMTIDMDANLLDCAYNTMDLNHPAFVHNNMLGFGSNIPPTNVNTVEYAKDDKVGLSFTYKSNSNLAHLKRELKKSQNFHVYGYPYNTWSRVSLPNNQHLIINVDLLPLAPNKTRWFVTMKFNYWNNVLLEKALMYFAANCILYQDKHQMARQAKVSDLKDLVMFQTVLQNEEHLDKLKNMLSKYAYPDKNKVLDLYQYHKQKHQI